MSSNQALKELHMERLRRLNQEQMQKQSQSQSQSLTQDNAIVDEASALAAQEQATVSSSTLASQEKEQEPTVLECPVCYNDGADCGIVSPACGHKLCLSCYSTILIREPKKAKCPCCRKQYLGAEAPPVSEDDYSDMPPLVSALDIILSSNQLRLNQLLGAANLLNISAYAHNLIDYHIDEGFDIPIDYHIGALQQQQQQQQQAPQQQHMT